MSRSRRKTTITGITRAETEKDDKRRANRSFRKLTKMQLRKGSEFLADIREVSNVWSFGKDGKVYRRNMDKKGMRK